MSDPGRRPMPASPTPSDDDVIPELLQGELDSAQVEALFADLRGAAQVTQVRVRSAAPGRPTDRTVTLDEAHRLLQAGQTPAVQIRYRYDGQLWCDTLMIRGDSTRLIRMPQPPDADDATAETEGPR